MDPSLDTALRETPAQRWRRRGIKLLLNVLYVALVYGIMIVAARMLHRRVLYQPPSPSNDDAALPEGATLLTTQASDGVTVHALEFAPAPVPNTANARAPRTIVHFHGNAENVEDNAMLAREMRRKGFDVVLVEYRGYGRSRGAKTDEAGLYLDASAILDLLERRGTKADHVVLWGQSLGTGVAAEMAHRKRGNRLVLVAPFTSTIDMGRRAAPFLPAELVMADAFDTLGKAPDIEAPTLVVHGDADDVIPVDQGERVSRALPHATFLKVPEGRHDNLYRSPSVVSAIVTHAGG